MTKVESLTAEHLLYRRKSFEGAALEVSQRLPENIYKKLAKTVSEEQRQRAIVVFRRFLKKFFGGEEENRLKVETTIRARDLRTTRLIEMSLGPFLTSSTSLH